MGTPSIEFCQVYKSFKHTPILAGMDFTIQSGETVTIIGGSSGHQLLSEPLELKRRPKTSIDGKYSIPFTTAVAIIKKNVTLSDFMPEALKDASVRQMAKKVVVQYDAQIDASRGIAPGIVEIKTKSGAVYSKRVDAIYGSPQNPMSKEDLVAKFKDCVSFSAKPVSRRKIDKVATMLDHLEEVSDVREVIKLLS